MTSIVDAEIEHNKKHASRQKRYQRSPTGGANKIPNISVKFHCDTVVDVKGLETTLAKKGECVRTTDREGRANNQERSIYHCQSPPRPRQRQSFASLVAGMVESIYLLIKRDRIDFIPFLHHGFRDVVNGSQKEDSLY
jgi:hypothetical protein